MPSPTPAPAPRRFPLHVLEDVAYDADSGRRDAAQAILDCGCTLYASTPEGFSAVAELNRLVDEHRCGDRERAIQEANQRLRAAHRDEWNRYYVATLEGTS